MFWALAQIGKATDNNKHRKMWRIENTPPMIGLLGLNELAGYSICASGVGS
jgi:hypothetical protein